MIEQKTQRMRLVVSGAISLYECQGLEIASQLNEQGRDDLLTVLDAVVTALYWLQSILFDDGNKTHED